MQDMFTKEDKEVAKQLVSDEKYVNLLAKIFLTKDDQLTTEIIREKTNDQLGEIVRADDLAEHKVRGRFSRLKMLAQGEEGKPKPAAKE